MVLVDHVKFSLNGKRGFIVLPVALTQVERAKAYVQEVKSLVNRAFSWIEMVAIHMGLRIKTMIKLCNIYSTNNYLLN